MDRMWGNHESTGTGVSDSRAGTTPTTKLTGGVSGFWKLEEHRVLQRALSSCGFRTRHRDSPRQPAGKEHENKGPYPPHPCCCIAGASHWPNTAVDHIGQSPKKEKEWIWRDKEKAFSTVFLLGISPVLPKSLLCVTGALPAPFVIIPIID